MTVQFDTSGRTRALTMKIIERLAFMDLPDSPDDDDPTTSDIIMDLSALKAAYPKANLKLLLASSDFDFVHDVYGIDRNIDKDDSSPTAGRLLNHFYPRFMRTSALDVQTFGRGKRVKV